MTETKRGGVSDEAMRAATGREWNAWRAWMDEHGAADLTHLAMVSLLREQGGVESGWWRQTLAVRYEQAIGRRVEGQTADTGFQIGVRRTLPITPDEAWRRLTSPAGLRAWLGAVDALPAKGESYRAADGSGGQVRVMHPGVRLRVTWRPEGWARASTLQVNVLPAGERATISFHEEHLPDAAVREQRRAHFAAALDALGSMDG